MRCTVSSRRVEPGCVIVRAVGAIGPDSAGEFREAVCQALTQDTAVLLLDFFELSFLSQEGLQTLREAQARLSSDHGDLVVVGAKGQVADVLQTVGIEDPVPATR